MLLLPLLLLLLLLPLTMKALFAVAALVKSQPEVLQLGHVMSEEAPARILVVHWQLHWGRGGRGCGGKEEGEENYEKSFRRQLVIAVEERVQTQLSVKQTSPHLADENASAVRRYCFITASVAGD